MREVLQKAVEQAISSLQSEDILLLVEMPKIEVSFPKDDTHGDYTSNIAFLLAHSAKKSPIDLAQLLMSRLSLPDGIMVSVSSPGYINFLLASSCYQDMIARIIRGDTVTPIARREKIMVEYSQPNTLKEFHIGHLRNVYIGSAMVNVLRHVGHEVIAVNYVGDTGTHIGKCLWGLEKFHSRENFEEREDKSAFLGKVYAEATQAIEQHPEYEEEAKALQRKLEEGDEKLVDLWKKTRAWSLEEFNKIYLELGVSFDVWFYESEEEIAGKKLLPELLKEGVVEKSDGAIIANLEKEGLCVLVLVRKDGSALYGLKDIPLAKRKFEEYGIDRSLYVVDVRQSLYFKQLFALLRRMGFERPMVHIGYEFVSLKGGKSMSSRKGNIVPAQEVMTAAREKVRSQFPLAPNPTSIALGAIRFSMLKHSSESKIIFDLEESTQLHGATGPYVQYAHARMCSIEKKAQGIANSETDSWETKYLTHPKERLLLTFLARYSEVVHETALDYSVHRLAHYAIELSDRFHSFYDECVVIDRENMDTTRSRLALVRATKIVLGETLRLLGISAPERM